MSDQYLQTLTPDQREELAEAARRKARGQKLSRPQRQLIDQWARAREEEERTRHLGAVPQRVWIELSGRQAKILNEQEQRYGIPVGRASIDVASVARWIHDAIRDGRIRDADPERAAEEDEWDRRLRRAKALHAELMYDRDKGELVRLDDIVDTFDVVAGTLAGGAERILEECGETAAAIYSQVIADVERALRQKGGGDDGPNPSEPGGDRPDVAPPDAPVAPARGTTGRRAKAAPKKKPGRVRRG